MTRSSARRARTPVANSGACSELFQLAYPPELCQLSPSPDLVVVRKLCLFTVFLMYPGVSSTVLSLFVCQDIDGQSYLVRLDAAKM